MGNGGEGEEAVGHLETGQDPRPVWEITAQLGWTLQGRESSGRKGRRRSPDSNLARDSIPATTRLPPEVDQVHPLMPAHHGHLDQMSDAALRMGLVAAGLGGLPAGLADVLRDAGATVRTVGEAV